jgi:hypothetical protein
VISLVMAFFWGVLGVVLIVYHATSSDPRGRIPLFGDISMGWAGLLLSLYNVLRWWSQRVMLAQKKAEWLARTRREDLAERRRRVEYGEPNPDFMFGDEPPPPKV